MGDKYAAYIKSVKAGDLFQREFEKGSLITQEIPEDGYLVTSNRFNAPPIFVSKTDLEKAEKAGETVVLEAYE